MISTENTATLQDKYLPYYHFVEKHQISVSQPPEKIYPLVDQLDFSGSRIIRILFALRGMPAQMMNRKGLEREQFTELERKDNEEIIVGLIGQFWRPSGNLQQFKPSDFIGFATPGFAKASWNFKLIPETSTTTRVVTETRIYCIGERTKKNFSRYWFFIRPFSGLIRMEVLKLIRRKAEHLRQ